MNIENHFQNEPLHVASSAPSNLQVGDGPSFASEGMGALSQSQSIARNLSESTSHQWEDLLDDPSLLEISYSGEEQIKEKKPKRKTTAKHTDKNTKREASSFSFRKEKYTTSVKNWLNHMGTDTALNIGILKDSSTSTPRPFDETVKIKNTQHFTQSQLANKNGVMKFVNPREINTNENSTRQIKQANAVATGKTAAEVINLQKRRQKKSPKLSEATGNSKFVAPLKRQSMTLTLASRDPAQRDN